MPSVNFDGERFHESKKRRDIVARNKNKYGKDERKPERDNGREHSSLHGKGRGWYVTTPTSVTCVSPFRTLHYSGITYGLSGDYCELLPSRSLSVKRNDSR